MTSLALWRQDWEAEMRASAERAAQVLRAADERKRGTVEGDRRCAEVSSNGGAST